MIKINGGIPPKRKRKLFNTIFFKYLCILLSVLIISYLLIFFVIHSISENHFTKSSESEIKRLSNAAVNMILHDIHNGDVSGMNSEEFIEHIRRNKEHIETTMASITNSTKLFMLICSSDGVARAFSNSLVKHGLLGNGLTPEICNSIRVDGYYLSKNDTRIFIDGHYTYALPIIDETTGATLGYAVACSPVSVVEAPVRETESILIALSGFIMIGAVLASYFISDKLVRPISNISRAAEAFSNGDFSARVPTLGNDEVGELAVVFNNMALSLEEMEKTRDTFLSNVSHDLRTPMTTIAGFIDGILDGAIPYEKQEYYLRIIREEVGRLSRLVSTLLDISRIQAGKREFKMSTFDVCETVRICLISLEKHIDKKNLNVSFECDEDRIYVNADMDAIHQVVYNICDNAVKFSYEGARLAISVRLKEKTVYVSIYNEGKGVSEEDLPYVFDRFYKADKSRGLDKNGTGLGLFICKTIMEAHGQSITVESKEDKFCLFTITLEHVKNKSQIQASEYNEE